VEATPRQTHVSASMLARASVGISREMLEQTLDLLPFAALLVEPGSARVRFANRAADALAGGRFPRPDGAERYDEMFRVTAPDGTEIAGDRYPAVRAARGERVEQCQVDWHLPGGVRSVLVSCDTIPPAEGREALILVAFEDITAIRRAEADAGAAQAVLDTFFSSASVGMAFLDRELRFRRVNDALARLNGIPAAEHIGRTASEVLPAGNPRVVALLRQVLETGEPVEADVAGYYATAPAEGHHWIVSIYPLRDAADDVAGVGATVTDITARVAAERRVAFLARAGEVLGRSLDFETTLRDVASIAVPELADWCIIDLLESGGGARRMAIAHDDPARERRGWELSERYPPGREEPGSLATVLRTGQSNLVAEIDDEMLRALARDDGHLAALRELDIAAALTAPLVVRGRVIGALTLLFGAARRRPGDADLDLATQVAARAATAIDNARLHRDRSHIARTLQRSLLPPRLPRIEGFEIAARYRAAGEGNEVGGDFYDVFQRTDSSWIVALGDVCGKGPEAAALTALARYTLRAAAISDGAPQRLMASLNEAILRDQHGGGASDRYMTAITGCLDLDPVHPVLTIGSAGHPPPVLVRADGAGEALDVGGRALGLLPGLDVGSHKVELEPGDTLLLYTDGVLDAGAPRRPFEMDELVATACAASRGPAAEMARAIERAALDRAVGAPRDDIAIVVLRRDVARR
jgi:PAS domain S-box-containing protein